ncbi:MAG: hypothetical protein GWM88_13670, partial [Pseudomonadales bacterium]|nr:C-type lectin domain-containing protein [Pseudomonadales bacterium]NIX08990.1 hypothetical protein [Pseudomonadales bacterium]
RLRSKLGLPFDAKSFPRSEPLIDPASNHYYARLEIPLPWHDAAAACHELGGHLAIITSPEENDLIQERFTNDRICWLGA